MARPVVPRYIVTGASGWVGQGVLHALRQRHVKNWANRVQVFGSQARTLTGPGGVAVQQRDLETLDPADVADAQVLHLAFLGRERCLELGEAAFREANRRIDAKVVAAIQAARTPPAGLFVASSGAARLAEQDIDPNPYALAKLEQETTFRALAKRTATPLFVGRIYSLAGPYMNKLAGYALSSFLLQATATGHVRIEAGRPVFRSYLHVLDLAALVLDALVQGDAWSGPRDLCGMEVVEMADVARVAARAVGVSPSAIFRGPVDCARPSAYLGDPVQTRSLALMHGRLLKPFDVQVRDTARWLLHRRA